MFYSKALKVRDCELHFGGGGCSLCRSVIVVQRCTKFKLKNSKEVYIFLMIVQCCLTRLILLQINTKAPQCP